ncbi:biopolymer transporter ExbD [Microvirga terrae]|uniref:Biopolymer transporter ExbD n=1 Tax=Microvirga terrae TaxID=2740529 RepID=A0ABY5RSV9_9HYPH|nr:MULTISPECIES: biopolymer transporter ExbD [Microvirga]MBQ0824720.1 biopolymer transporter ExbD [Microvirga sp. HBU67558]UVF20343.1 biopolymer transporter ExbD [Microvirga terrae]
MGMGPIRAQDTDDEFGSAPLSEINVTPLVDVMLVLLIIFMVAAPLMTVGVPVQLPKTAAPKVSQPKQPVVVTIDAQGQPFLDKEPLAPETMMPRLRQLAGVDPSQVVLVRGDKAVPYGRIIEIMGQINAAGFSKVSLIAQAPSGSPSP